MVLSAFLGVTVAVVLCAVGIRHAFRLLGLDARQTFLWLGLLEVPAPPVSRRASERARRGASSPGTAAASTPRAA
jgi:hypothetical protein